MGVLIATNRLTRTQAFELLKIAGQNSNRKLRDVAADVADTGLLELPDVPQAARTRRGRCCRSWSHV